MKQFLKKNCPKKLAKSRKNKFFVSVASLVASSHWCAWIPWKIPSTHALKKDAPLEPTIPDFCTWKNPCFCNKMELFCWFSNTVLLFQKEENKEKENVERYLISYVQSCLSNRTDLRFFVPMWQSSEFAQLSSL